MVSKILVGSLGITAILAGSMWYLALTKNRIPTAVPYTYSGPVEKISIANVGEYSIFNIIAKNKGYFTKYGLDATVTEYSSGVTSMAGLTSGKVDVAIAGDFVGVHNMFTYPDLRIITEASKQSVWQLIGRKDKGINTTADLKGKKVGLTKSGSGQYYLGGFLTLNKINYSDLIIVDLSPVELEAHLASGQIDAAVVFEPYGYNLLKKLGNQATIFQVQGDAKAVILAFTTKGFIDTHSSVLERYVRALVDADKYVKSNPENAKRILATTMHYDDAYVQHVWPKFVFGTKLDQELILTMEDQASWMMENSMMEKAATPNYIDFIDFKPLETAKPGASSIIR